METATLVPREGLIVRDPTTGKALDAAGEKKPLSSYWRRRLSDGDVQTKAPTRRASREED